MTDSSNSTTAPAGPSPDTDAIREIASGLFELIDRTCVARLAAQGLTIEKEDEEAGLSVAKSLRDIELDLAGLHDRLGCLAFLDETEASFADVGLLDYVRATKTGPGRTTKPRSGGAFSW